MRSVASLRRLALTGVWSGLAASVGYLEPIPWLELQSIVVFAAGYFLGVTRGAAVGALAMAVFSLANPYAGATSVNAGTLRVTGSINNSAVSVASGATLAGTGSSGWGGIGSRRFMLSTRTK